MNALDIPTYAQDPDGEQVQVCSQCFVVLSPPDPNHPLCADCEPEDAQDERKQAQGS